MLKVKDSSQQAQKIYQQVHEVFSEYNISPTPINYLIWYQFYRGEHTELINEMKSILKSPRQFTERLGFRLYEQFLEQEQIEAENKYDFAVRQFVDDIIEKLGNWTDSLGEHSQQMGQCAIQLKAGTQNSSELEKVATYIAETAMSMQQSTDEIRKEVLHNNDEVKMLREQLREAKAEALTDELTQIGNRKAFDSSLMDLTLEHKSKPNQLCLIMTDIDHFKSFNDTYGHPVGDSVLRYFSNIMKNTTSKNETLCRYGGEEFAIILKNCSIEEASHRAEEIRRTIEAARLTLKNSDEPIRQITASFGIAHFQGSEDDIEAFVERADQSLYKAKQAGRNQIVHELMHAVH